MPKFYYESGWVQSSSVLIVLGSAYGDTASVTSCNKWSQYVISWIATNWIKLYLSLSRYRRIGLLQEVEQLGLTFFSQRF